MHNDLGWLAGWDGMGRDRRLQSTLNRMDHEGLCTYAMAEQVVFSSGDVDTDGHID